MLSRSPGGKYVDLVKGRLGQTPPEWHRDNGTDSIWGFGEKARRDAQGLGSDGSVITVGGQRIYVVQTTPAVNPCGSARSAAPYVQLIRTIRHAKRLGSFTS